MSADGTFKCKEYCQDFEDEEFEEKECLCRLHGLDDGNGEYQSFSN